ncbi:MAG TPA: hypothetical protein PLF32_08765 [Bacteroidales bacterium]|jgi:hypothetical protein|nr:hypothetical protein [Bacteroidales bacterium]HOF16976.1 hypothetical protein [Bacteroidales bacterium]HOR82729.1 hypothetical protein [Bacteroidales bacterium]HPJ91943.1 hypothetical protein [Bacteroidales bacterium]
MIGKKIIFGLCLFCMFLCFSHCNINKDDASDSNPYMETIIISYKIPKEDMIWVNLKQYEVKKEFYPILDSIINLFTECYGDVKNRYGFWFRSYEKDENVEISIYAIEKQRFKYSLCTALFYYKQYQFGYSGIFLDSYFEDTGKIIQYHTIKREAIIYHPKNDTSSSYWYFIYYGNNIIKPSSFFHREEFWYDDTIR